jgi:hypothetical protein
MFLECLDDDVRTGIFAVYVIYCLHTNNKLISDSYLALIHVETNRVVQVNMT